MDVLSDFVQGIVHPLRPIARFCCSDTLSQCAQSEEAITGHRSSGKTASSLRFSYMTKFSLAYPQEIVCNKHDKSNEDVHHVSKMKTD